MPTSASFSWAPSPTIMVPALTTWDSRIVQGLHDLADFFAAKMEAYAKANAPWNDQTGAARQGLRGIAVKAATSIIIQLVHSVEYGIYLELGTSRMAAREIIMPTLAAHYSEIMGRIRALVGG